MAGGLLLGSSALPSPAAAASGAEPPRLTVRVYDYARLPAPILEAAARQAAELLGRSGLSTSWRACWNQAIEPSRCHEPLTPGELIVKVLARRRDAPLPVARDGFGFALVPPSGEPGVMTGVFAEAAEALARSGDASLAQILGTVAAHEIGHLLLGERGHARSGLMSSPWSRGAIRAAARGQLILEPDQASRMRATIADRASGVTARAAANVHEPVSAGFISGPAVRGQADGPH